MKTRMNMMPIIITKVGHYRTFGGQGVTIDRIDDHSDDLSVTRFNCKGFLHIEREGKSDILEYNIWHQSGKYDATQEGSDRDIVE
jgi:hypothetical protein